MLTLKAAGLVDIDAGEVVRPGILRSDGDAGEVVRPGILRSDGDAIVGVGGPQTMNARQRQGCPRS